MITLTGSDVNLFHYLLGLFAPVFDKYSPFVDDEGYIVKKLRTMEGQELS
jgi:hypothetical protein